MEEGSILTFLDENFNRLDGGATYLRTFSTIPKGGLFTAQLTNRPSKSWPKAQVLYTSEDEQGQNLSECIEKWKDMCSGYNDQFLIIKDHDQHLLLLDYKGEVLAENDNVFSAVVRLVDRSYSQSIRNIVEEDYTIDELAEILAKLHDKHSSPGIVLFAIKYGRFLQEIKKSKGKDSSFKSLMEKAGVNYDTFQSELSKGRKIYSLIKKQLYGLSFLEDTINLNSASKDARISSSDISFIRAMRTKPFLLLAGISGTGKSRIVKQLAFKSCPDKGGLRKDPTSPGNYCLVEVKPNWHDSTELLGYQSQIKNGYVLTPFVKFLVKAMLHPDTPFFVCLDEMNLAPVEQYFAEFLSVLESRKKHGDHITSEALVPSSVFASQDLSSELFDFEKPVAKGYSDSTSDDEANYGPESSVYDTLMRDGLRIPENVIVIGTVNMDETTHQFSRKVIDRAMTIEMNIADGTEPFSNFFEKYEDLGYPENPLLKELFLPKYVSADQALATMDAETVDFLKAEVPVRLAALNEALNGTPFKIAYRVQNELVLYFASLLADSPEAAKEDLLTQAIDGIMMMKVLPRIEGDEDLLKKPLNRLADFAVSYPLSAEKIKEMQERLERGHFTSFWP